jgi:hypothetical protein
MAFKTSKDFNEAAKAKNAEAFRAYINTLRDRVNELQALMLPHLEEEK